METNVIYCGNNLEIMQQFPDKCVDLIYADPPFFSGKIYESFWKDTAEKRQFDDRWVAGKKGISVYISWMSKRLRQCHRILKDTGSMYLHCDWHANAHLRITMDKIFGDNNFRNEIIWHYTGGGRSKSNFSRKHDTILLYSKSNTMRFNLDAIRVPYKETSGYAHGGIVSKSGKQYMPNPEGTPMDDVWDIPIINPLSCERIGYPTQKPEALLRRIIEASSNKGDIVLDPFCGCGTAIAVAQYLQRQWIGIDVSPTACSVMQKRLADIKKGIRYDAKIIGFPTTIEELKNMKPFEFQNWVVGKKKGIPSKRLAGDKGIDGWVIEALRDAEIPIQVKQKEHVGRPDVQKFESAIRAENKCIGHIYAFSFTSDAIEEVARLKLENDIDIQLIEVKTLLGLT